MGYGPMPGYAPNAGPLTGNAGTELGTGNVVGNPGPAAFNPGTGIGTGPAALNPGVGAGANPYMGNTGMTNGPAAGNGTNMQTGANPGGTTNAGAAQSADTAVLALVNGERAKAGLAPLTLNKQLSDVARTKAQDMRDQNYFDHTSPTYGSPSDMIKRFNVQFGAVGENIAAGQRTPAEVMQGWMNSEGHRRNILDPQFTEMGLGSVQGGQMGTYWSQMFINH